MGCSSVVDVLLKPDVLWFVYGHGIIKAGRAYPTVTERGVPSQHPGYFRQSRARSGYVAERANSRREIALQSITVDSVTE